VRRGSKENNFPKSMIRVARTSAAERVLPQQVNVGRSTVKRRRLSLRPVIAPRRPHLLICKDTDLKRRILYQRRGAKEEQKKSMLVEAVASRAAWSATLLVALLHVAVTAEHRSAFDGLKRHLRLLSARAACRIVHFSRCAAEAATAVARSESSAAVTWPEATLSAFHFSCSAKLIFAWNCCFLVG
jgi:hypothetical protein